MPISDCCNIGVVCCESNATIADVASLMRRHHVGDVVVVKYNGEGRKPLGIVTDRDIVVETIAQQVDISLLTAGDIMTSPLVTVNEQEGLTEALRIMRQHKVRRLPVVDDDGALYGIVTADDIINLLTAELSMITAAITEQPVVEGHLRR